jgi:hypothetical protein
VDGSLSAMFGYFGFSLMSRVFGTLVQLNVMGFVSHDELAVTRYLRHPEETSFVGVG